MHLASLRTDKIMEKNRMKNSEFVRTHHKRRELLEEDIQKHMDRCNL